MGIIILWSTLRKLYIKIVKINTKFRVEGYSLNYYIMNFSGYLLYSIYMSLGYFTDIKGAGTVILPDLIFVYHAMLMMLIYGIQSILYKVLIN